MALKQRAEQNVHTEPLDWEEEEEGECLNIRERKKINNLTLLKRLSFRLLPSDDFLGVAPSTHLNPATRLDGSTGRLPAPLSTTGPASPCEDATLSVSSDSVSLPTQVEVRPEPRAAALVQKLSEASLDDSEVKVKRDSPCEVEAAAPTVPQLKGEVVSKAPPTTKEEGPQDLRVFELNSDSGKSTPSNNGKKGRGRF